MVYCVYHLFCSKTYITTFTIIYIYIYDTACSSVDYYC